MIMSDKLALVRKETVIYMQLALKILPTRASKSPLLSVFVSPGHSIALVFTGNYRRQGPLCICLHPILTVSQNDH